MSRAPNGMHNKDGWQRINCVSREAVYRTGGDLSPVSSVTDPDGHYGTPVTFTEWWCGEVPILRDYLYEHGDGEPACRHYIASGHEAYREDED